GRDPERRGCTQRRSPTRTSRQEQAGYGETLRKPVQENGHENEEPERGTHVEAARDGHAIEERVEQQPDQRRRADRGVHLVRLLSEMEMARERVLREVNE